MRGYRAALAHCCSPVVCMRYCVGALVNASVVCHEVGCVRERQREAPKAGDRHGRVLGAMRVWLGGAPLHQGPEASRDGLART